MIRSALHLLALAALVSPAAPAFAVEPIRLADWKSFIHGDAPAFVKAPPPKELAVVATASGVPVDAQVESFMRALAGAVMARDAAAVLPRLSVRYAVEGMPDDAKASEFMAQAIGKMPGPTRIVIQSVQARGEVRTAKVEFHYGAEKVKVKTFRFDPDGNLLESDLFSLSRG